METLQNTVLFKYKPDTLQFLRNQYGFDTLQRMNEAIDALNEWAAKQEHFVVKHFDRNYLERLLICNKGSVEKCKKKLDKLCTLRTLVPECFSMEKINKDLFFGSYSDAVLSEMTPDHGRVHHLQFHGRNFNTVTLNCYCRYLVLIYNYIQMKDYCNHITFIVEWVEGSVLEFVKALDFTVFRKNMEIAFEGLSLRIKAIHFVTESKTIDVFVGAMKSVLSAKLGERIQVHKTMDTVYENIPRELFPQEYGGNDKPLSELREVLYNELYSDEFTEYRKEMNKAYTNEALRRRDTFNEEYMGLSGTFRSLSVD